MKKRILLSALFSLSYSAELLQFDVLSGKEKTKQANLLLSEKGVHLFEAENSPYTVFYERSSNSMTLIDNSSKSWYKIDSSAVEGIKQTVEASKQMMLMQLQKMPAEQQAVMKGILESKFGPMDEQGTKAPKADIRPLEKTSQGLSQKCNWYASYQNNTASSEFCLEKLDTKYQATLLDFGKFLELLNSVPQISEASPFSMPSGALLKEGFPVIYRLNHSGKTEETKLVKHTKNSAEKSFSAPKDYKQQKLPF